MESTTQSAYHLIDVIPNILLFFGIAGVVVPLLHHLKVSSVLAYLLCGIMIGPYGLAIFIDDLPWLSYVTITETSIVHILGELGVISLMFMIGLELSLDRLKELRRYILGLGSTQILSTAIIIFLIASFFDNSLEAAILLGASFALSSTAIVMNFLEEKHLTNRPIGILCFSILLMQDIAVIPILVLATSFTGSADDNIAQEIFMSLAIGVATVISMYIIGKRILKPLLQSVSLSHSPEWLMAFIIFIVIACAAFTYSVGLSVALGAFLAGLLISETEFKHEVEVTLNPIRGVLLGIFFLSIGMMINIEEILLNPFMLLISVLGIYTLKAMILFPLCLLFKVPPMQAGQASVYLSEPGEFALMILGVAMASQIMPAHNIQFFLLVTALAMLFSPVLFKLAPFAGMLAHRLFKDDMSEGGLSHPTEHLVIVAGLGRVGQLLCDVLEKQKIPYIAFDNNAERVKLLKQQGIRIIYGDAKKKELWHRLINENTVAVVVAIDNYSATNHITRSLCKHYPSLPVIVRSEDVYDVDSLYDNGAKYGGCRNSRI